MFDYIGDFLKTSQFSKVKKLFKRNKYELTRSVYNKRRNQFLYMYYKHEDVYANAVECFMPNVNASEEKQIELSRKWVDMIYEIKVKAILCDLPELPDSKETHPMVF